ncbi:ParB/Srx family N-terminal domain-containing protein [Vibrio sp. Vb2354]|uniref:ParB/Srx family N-terminal domain-containing protein n=1 Tax=unclassified Vibrio TaxID=2614977 RepID=UPI00296522E5|nr:MULTISPECIES: ParB/Srx family N-terminal domain-containing protein [unclassified Vibrio]MDW1738420.1 ParB/Srx family N-terminal domain-containing protein [Vibrio sp. Vb2321]MDW1757471.1 ParB/Srx family N-terminal domain-containing protein [Vibrio sp. Vb2353]MDW1771795.1 ParB/Srx family N-terminal domain-containing protein [Vibrio sp. Vb2354]MDW1809184.1 ParB/Srx family N-terminal domain-containing protein [Vibrio sp. Vb2362]
MKKGNWWETRTPRAVDQLKLWVDNPRLDPIESHDSLNDFIDDLLSDTSEKEEFIDLVKSISERGFTSFDPVVVWKDEKGQHIVAEGNRRVLALKLLRRPEIAPKVIRKFMREQAKLIDRDEIEKIRVCVAPSYDETRWYILQRHSTGSLLKRWQRLQQQRFILNAYEEQNEDIDATIEVTGLKRGEIIEALRYVCLRNIATRIEVTSKLSPTEQDAVYSHRISMTVLERWFGRKLVREKWGVEFDGMDVVIHSEMSSFLNAYAKFLKLMLNPGDNELGFPINTRTIDGRFDEIFKALPEVVFPGDTESVVIKPEKFDAKKEKAGREAVSELTTSQKSDDKREDASSAKEGSVLKPIKANPDRNQMVSTYQTINVSSYKLKALFREFQLLPVNRYKNISAASLRVFLDLAVDEFISTLNLQQELSQKERKHYSEVTLLKRLQFLQGEHVKSKEANKVIKELLNHSNEYSLNTLNEYIHGTRTHKTNRRFVNGFWDMLTPLFAVLIELKDK